MANQEKINIPDLIDEQPHFLIWQLDEVVPVLIGLIAGIIIGSPLLGIAAGLVGKHYYTKHRDGKPRGYFKHLLREKGIALDGIKPHTSMLPPLVDKFHS